VRIQDFGLTILMVSSGDRILREPISNEVSRHIAYADRAGELQMLVFSNPAHGLRSTEIRPNLVVHPVHARNRAEFVVRAVASGRRICQQSGVDLITTQDPFDTAVIGTLLARRFRIPLEIQNHSNFYADSEWARERRGFGMAKRLGRHTLPRAALLRILNEAERHAYISMGLSSDRIRILPTPVDVSTFLDAAERARESRDEIRGAWGLQSEDVVAIWAGRMVASGPNKRLLFWLDVAARLAERLASIRFVLIGDGPQRGELEAKAEALGIEDRVVFTGPLPNEELPTAFAAADIYMHTSRHEGFGKVIVEAQAAGLPVVAVNAHGPSSIVVDGVTGFILEADLGRMADAVLGLCRSEAMRKQMGEAAREHVRQNYRYEWMVDAIVSAWEETVGICR